MKKIIVVSDSFKGTLGSIEICGIARETIKNVYPECDVVTIPVADGGEGTVECFKQTVGGELVTTEVNGPYMEPLKASYLLNGKQAFIEMASAAGLPLVQGNKNPMLTTTYGVGQQMKHAIEQGATKIVLGLGGSSTNDGGCGCAAAMGVIFKDENDKEFIPTGGTLSKIRSIDISRAEKLLENCRISAMCDIDNPMYGPMGAAYIFGPQKGADENTVKILDDELRSLDKSFIEHLNKSIALVPGAGSAGAMGAGMLAFFDAELKSGIQTVLDVVEFERKLEGVDFVITGEGRIDAQSLMGKVVAGVSVRASKLNVPVVAIVGAVSDDAYGAYDMGVSAIFSTGRIGAPFNVARTRADIDYRNTLNDILRLLKVFGK